MTNPTPTPHSADPVVSLLYRLAAKEAKDCQFETAVKIRACADFIAQRDASYPVAADQAEGLSLADVDELCAEFGFRLPDNEGRVCSKEVLRDMITAAITRWPLAAEPVTDPLQSEALLEIKPADAPVPQEAVLLDKGSGLMAFGMGRLGAFPAPQQSAAPPAVDISDKSVAGIRAVLLGLARSASPDAQPAAQPVNLAELHDPDFSGGLTPSQHLDVVHGGADPRVAASQVQGVLADRYEFSVVDSDDREVAGGSAPMLTDAIREGRNYLSQYNQDGPHKLELRRVLVLDHSEATNA
jgi:hypothetical protein